MRFGTRLDFSLFLSINHVTYISFSIILDFVTVLSIVTHSRPQSLRSLWPAAGISFSDRWSRGTKALGTRLIVT